MMTSVCGRPVRHSTHTHLIGVFLHDQRKRGDADTHTTPKAHVFQEVRCIDAKSPFKVNEPCHTSCAQTVAQAVDLCQKRIREPKLGSSNKLNHYRPLNSRDRGGPYMAVY